MYRCFDEIEEKARRIGPRPVAVLFPDDPHVMQSIADGVDHGLIDPVLVGRRDSIGAVAESVGFSRHKFEIIDENDPQKAADLCIEMARTGQISFVVKGKIITSFLYRSLIRHTKMSDPGRVPCTLCFHQARAIGKIFVITDPGVHINPDVECRARILENAIMALRQMGCKKPRVMVLASASTAQSSSLSRNGGDILERIITENKSIRFDICEARSLCTAFPDWRIPTDDFPDIFLVPHIDCGNILVKAVDHLGGGIRQCVTVGGGIAVLTPSRSDGYAARIANLSLGIVLSKA